MIPNYTVEYQIPLKRQMLHQSFYTDDPVTLEEFLSQLLAAGYNVISICHKDQNLSDPEFDRLLKTAAGMLATTHLCRSLGIDEEEAHFRFGFPAWKAA